MTDDWRAGWISGYIKGLVASAARIGLDATDTDEMALRKRLAVVLCAGTLPLTLLWSAIYLAVGAPLAAAIPAFYSVFTPINTLIFARTRIGAGAMPSASSAGQAGARVIARAMAWPSACRVNTVAAPGAGRWPGGVEQAASNAAAAMAMGLTGVIARTMI